MTTRRMELTVASLAGATAANAVAGAVYAVRGAPNVPLEWLEGSPFSDYRTPGWVLGTVVGGTSAVAAGTALAGSEHAGDTAQVAGATLTAWIAAQVALIGYRSPLQPLMAAIGVTMLGLGKRLR